MLLGCTLLLIVSHTICGTWLQPSSHFPDGIDYANKLNPHINAHADGATAQGMTLHLDSWPNTAMYSTEGKWIATQDL